MSRQPTKTLLIPVLLLFIFFLWMCARIPYTGDDWSWGTEIGLKWLVEATENNRYAGNILECVLTRSEFLKTLIMALTFTLIPLLEERIVLSFFEPVSSSLRCFVLILAYALFFSLSPHIWQQTNGWVAGFANYCFSLLVLCILFLLVLSYLRRPENASFGLGKTLTAGVVCFVLQLYLENLSIYVLFVALLLFVVSWIRRKHFPGFFAVILLCAAAGTVVIFLSKLYLELFRTGEYAAIQRSLSYETGSSPVEAIKTMLWHFESTILKNLYEYNIRICPAILLVLTMLVYRKKKGSKVLWLFLPLASICMVYLFSSFADVQSKLYTIYWTLNVYYTVCFSLLFFLLVIFGLWLVFSDRREKLCAALFLWFSVPTVILPMAAVGDIVGGRIYYIVQHFLYMFMLLLSAELFNGFGMKSRKVLSCTVSVALVVFVLYFGSVYSSVGKVKSLRSERIRQAVAEDAAELELPVFPYGEYIWGGEPPNEGREKLFKKYFGIPEHMELHFS